MTDSSSTLPPNFVAAARASFDTWDMPNLALTTAEMAAQVHRLPFFVHPILVNAARLALDDDHFKTAIDFVIVAANAAAKSSQDERNTVKVYSQIMDTVLNIKTRLDVHNYVAKRTPADCPLNLSARAAYMDDLRRSNMTTRSNITRIGSMEKTPSRKGHLTVVSPKQASPGQH